MKTLNLYALSFVGLVSLGLAACGDDSGGNNTQNRRFNFTTDQARIVNPLNGDTGVCLQEAIQVEIPSDSNACRNNSGFEENVVLARLGSSTQIPLTKAIMVEKKGKYCIMEMYPDASAPNGAGLIFPQTQYQVSLDLDQLGTVVLDTPGAHRFTTGTYAQNANCEGLFTVTSPGWEETTALRTGLKDEDGSTIFDANDFLNFTLSYLNGAGIQFLGIGNLNASAPINIQMNEPINASSVLNGVRMFKLQGSWPLFNGLNGSQISVEVDPSNPFMMQIWPAGISGHAPGTYVVFVDEVLSNTGKLHPLTTFKIFTVNN